MPKVGDRVIIEGSKVGQQRREGSLIAITGRLLNVRWNDGTTSMLTPGAGSVRFISRDANGSTGPRKSRALKKAAVSTKKTASAGRKVPGKGLAAAKKGKPASATGKTAGKKKGATKKKR